MNIDIPEGEVIIHGKSQGYLGLPVRHETTHTRLTDGSVMTSNGMVTRWSPTEEERAAIVAGEDIYVRILGPMPPPMMVGVGDPAKAGW